MGVAQSVFWRIRRTRDGVKPHSAEQWLATDTRIGRMRRALYDRWRQHQAEGMLPTSARFFYYELVALGVISKTTEARSDGKKGRRSDQDMIDALTDLRKTAIIPWADIVDETRELMEWEVFDSIADAMREKWKTARLNLWESHRPPMILCESRSLRGVLEPLASEYQCPIASTNGQVAGFLHTTIGPALAPGDTVLYFGDADLAGNHIEANTRKVLEEIVGGPLNWERVAITEEQIKQFKLPIIQKYDKRTRSSHPAVETEALGQSRIVALLRDRLRKLMPEARRRRVHVREAEERAKIGRKLGLRQDRGRVSGPSTEKTHRFKGNSDYRAI
jgi:hypothetical protein